MKICVLIDQHLEIVNGANSEEEAIKKVAEYLLSLTKEELINTLTFITWEER